MMSNGKFGIEVNFLTGRYVATAHHDRKLPEWPPHPARLFSALVATWADADETDPSERQALEWLEAQRPPEITASTAVPRTVGSHFVPVNDVFTVSENKANDVFTVSVNKAKTIYKLEEQLHDELVSSGGEITKKVAQIMPKLDKARDGIKEVFPDHRPRQQRFFPSMTPDSPRVTYVWDDCPPNGLSDVLDGLLGRVTRLGHSSSLVSCRSAPEMPEATYIPRDDGGGESLRGIRNGQLAELERQHGHHGGNRTRSLPFVDVRYQAVAGILPGESPPQKPNTIGDWLVFEFEHGSRAMPVTRTVELAKVMRATVFHHAKDPLREELSGHQPGGKPAVMPHVAFLPLPFVGFQRADGRLLGIAVSMPQEMDDVARQEMLRIIGAWEEKTPSGSLTLTMGAHGVVKMSRLRGPATLISLRPEVWSNPSRRWTSATPIALPKHPGQLSRGSQTARAKAWAQAEAAVAAACAHVGLPEPVSVVVSLNPFIAGARVATQLPAFNQKGRNGQLIRRQLVHATLTFEHKVAGPLMLGSGRFLGLGLMRPVSDDENQPPARGKTDKTSG